VGRNKHCKTKNSPDKSYKPLGQSKSITTIVPCRANAATDVRTWPQDLYFICCTKMVW